MGKRVRLTNDSLNSYGTRILTAGMDTKQYERNPVLLYMHGRGQVIGMVKNLQCENGELTGELEFDEATELSQRCKKQYEFGSLRMVSVGVDILETSSEKSVLLDGQTRPTITKSKLYEVSVVDIGANDDAIVLKKDGALIELGKDGECALPLLNQINKPKRKEMEEKTLALLLGLPETADESAIKSKLAELQASKQEEEKLRKENETLRLGRITAVVDKAIADNLIGADKKEQFVELGKKTGVEDLENTFAAMSPRVKVSTLINKAAGPTVHEYKKLGDVPECELAKLRAEQPDEYKRLYKAEYGMDAEI